MHARGWLAPFFGWHNDDHHHGGLALFTPAEVFHGRVSVVHALRQDTLSAAYALHPARFPNGPPKAALPPAEVHINPLEALTVDGTAERFVAKPRIVVKNRSAPVDDQLPPIRIQTASDALARTPRRQTPVAAAAALPS